MNIEDIHKHLLEIDKLLDSLKKLKTCVQTGGQGVDSETSEEIDVDDEMQKVKNIDNDNLDGGAKEQLDLPETDVKNIDPDFSMSIMEMI
jgi:hypothetical protein